jgi:hypothetical protein
MAPLKSPVRCGSRAMIAAGSRMSPVTPYCPARFRSLTAAASVFSERNSLIQPIRLSSSGTLASAINASCSIRLRWISGNSANALFSARCGDEARKYFVSHGRKTGKSLK